MRKIIGAIFGSSKNTENIVSGAMGGIDKIFFTQQEKAEASGKVAEWYLKYLAATQPQNLARRLIALVVVLLWAFLIVVGIIARGIEIWIQRGAEIVTHPLSTFIFETLNELVHQPFMLIMGFYFLAHVVRTYQNGKGK